MVKLERKKKIQKFPFWIYIKNINAFIFWCMVIPLGPHLDHGKKPSFMVQLYGPWCKPALNNEHNCEDLYI